MILIYRVLFLIGLIVCSPYLLVKAIWGRHGILERLGFIGHYKINSRLFWFHAASVGELKILAMVIPEIKKRLPDISIAISTTTATGKRRAKEIFDKDTIIFLQPLEIKTVIGRVLNTLRPEKLIVVETELWPLMLTTAHENGTNIYLINARMSQRSFRFYKILKSLISPVLRKFNEILTQTESDTKRYSILGAKSAHAIGNIKYDQVLDLSNNGKSSLKIDHGNDLIFVAGSIRRGEDEIFADLIHKSINDKLPMLFILVPRHMKDLDRLKNLLESRSILFDLWSVQDGSIDRSHKVLVVDTMGELREFYRIANLAFVGGSMVSIGGHDPVEPAAFGKPILFGPYMQNAAEAARLLVQSGGATIVKDINELEKSVRNAVQNRDELAKNGEKCRQVILSMTGVSKKTADILLRDLK